MFGAGIVNPVTYRGLATWIQKRVRVNLRNEAANAVEHLPK